MLPFTPGTRVWVLLAYNNIWWPGTVAHPSVVPPLEVYENHDEDVIAYVYFNTDERYVAVTCAQNICLYSSPQKLLFINDGYLLYYIQKECRNFCCVDIEMEVFILDVLNFELEIGGDTNIFHQFKIKYDNIFKKQENKKLSPSVRVIESTNSISKVIPPEINKPSTCQSSLVKTGHFKYPSVNKRSTSVTKKKENRKLITPTQVIENTDSIAKKFPPEINKPCTCHSSLVQTSHFIYPSVNKKSTSVTKKKENRKFITPTQVIENTNSIGKKFPPEINKPSTCQSSLVQTGHFKCPPVNKKYTSVTKKQENRKLIAPTQVIENIDSIAKKFPPEINKPSTCHTSLVQTGHFTYPSVNKKSTSVTKKQENRKLITPTQVIENTDSIAKIIPPEINKPSTCQSSMAQTGYYMYPSTNKKNIFVSKKQETRKSFTPTQVIENTDSIAKKFRPKINKPSTCQSSLVQTGHYKCPPVNEKETFVSKKRENRKLLPSIKVTTEVADSIIKIPSKPNDNTFACSLSKKCNFMTNCINDLVCHVSVHFEKNIKEDAIVKTENRTWMPIVSPYVSTEVVQVPKKRSKNKTSAQKKKKLKNVDLNSEIVIDDENTNEDENIIHNSDDDISQIMSVATPRKTKKIVSKCKDVNNNIEVRKRRGPKDKVNPPETNKPSTFQSSLVRTGHYEYCPVNEREILVGEKQENIKSSSPTQIIKNIYSKEKIFPPQLNKRFTSQSLLLQNVHCKYPAVHGQELFIGEKQENRKPYTVNRIIPLDNDILKEWEDSADDSTTGDEFTIEKDNKGIPVTKTKVRSRTVNVTNSVINRRNINSRRYAELKTRVRADVGFQPNDNICLFNRIN